jgi:hypothetical protein
MMASETAAIAKASIFMRAGMSAHSRIVRTGPPVAVARPQKGSAWMRVMMAPIPDMKPDTTE